MHVQTAECTSRRDHGKQSKMNLTLLDTLFVILSWSIVYCAGAVVAFWIRDGGWEGGRRADFPTGIGRFVRSRKSI